MKLKDYIRDTNAYIRLELFRVYAIAISCVDADTPAVGGLGYRSLDSACGVHHLVVRVYAVQRWFVTTNPCRIIAVPVCSLGDG